MNWDSPLRPPKEEKKEERFKKPKCRISKSTVRKITNQPVSTASCEWMERWLEDFVRSHSYPPQLISDDFYSRLTTYFPVAVATTILEKLKRDYELAFPMMDKEPEFSIDNLYAILSADNAVVLEFPFLFVESNGETRSTME